MGAELLIWLKWTAILIGALIALLFFYVLVMASRDAIKAHKALRKAKKLREAKKAQPAPQIKKASPKGWAIKTDDGYILWAATRTEAIRRYLSLDPAHNYVEGKDYFVELMTYEQWQNLPED